MLLPGFQRCGPLLVVALVSLLGTPAAAVPIGVRAKTHVVLVHHRGPNGVVLVGRLLDDTDLPVRDERVTLELPPIAPVQRMTDETGRFEVPLSAREVARLTREGDLVGWTARFDGNSRLGEAAESGAIDLSKRATRLGVSIVGAEGPVVLGERPVEITVSLADVSDGAEVPIARAEVALEVGKASELVGTTGKSGGATFVVRPSSFAGGGRYRIAARFGGDTLYAPSRVETELHVLLPTRLTLRVVREGDEQRGRYRMSGRLSDERAPLAGQVVAIVATSGSRKGFELLTATDDEGVFVTALSAAELQALRETLGDAGSRLEVRARYAPADALHAPSGSAPVALEIPQPPGVPLRWYILGLALVVGFIALAQALRSGALARLSARALATLRALLERLRGRRPSVAPVGPEPVFVTPFSPPGEARVRASDTLSGLIVEAQTRAPLAGRISARSGDDLRAASAGRDGRFSLGPLPPGAWLVVVEAPGHLPREIALEVPHSGDYDGAHWALVAVHRRVREIFSGALAGLGTPLAWGYATPREATREAITRASDPPVVTPPLSELTAIVEHTHFARDVGTAADVERARALKTSLEQRPPIDGSAKR